jgi:hypothetical protein
MKQKSQQVPHGEKTIKVTIALWTDGVPGAKPNRIRKGHAYDNGAIYMPLNRSHGITRSISGIPFGDNAGLKEIPDLIRRLARKHGVVLHRARS